MIRVHPSCGGLRIQNEDDFFQGVSTDVFFQLDLFDPSQTYHVTRKINMTIQIDPSLVPCDAFFESFIESGNLHEKGKSIYCGNTGQGGLVARLGSIPLHSFVIQGEPYAFDSIGIAAGEGFVGLNGRRCSHLEIKYVSRQTPLESMVLNLHLSSKHGSGYNLQAVRKRFHACMNLFEVLLRRSKQVLRVLPKHLDVKVLRELTLANFSECGYSISKPSIVPDGAPDSENSYKVAYYKYLAALEFRYQHCTVGLTLLPVKAPRSKQRPRADKASAKKKHGGSEGESYTAPAKASSTPPHLQRGQSC
jgi:hypothetical protein